MREGAVSPTGFMFRYLGGERLRIASLAVILVVNIAVELLLPQFIRTFIDEAGAGAPVPRLLAIAGMFAGVSAVWVWIAVATTYLTERVAWGATDVLRGVLIRHCLHLDMRFHNRHTPGEMVERLDGDTSSVGTSLSQFAINMAGNSLLLAGVLGVLFRENWRIGVGMSAFAAVTALLIARLRHVSTDAWRATRQQNGEFFGFLEERLSGAEDINACGASQFVLRSVVTRSRALLASTTRAAISSSILSNMIWVLSAMGNAIALGLSWHLWSKGAITVGTVYLIYTYSNRIVGPIRKIGQHMEGFQRASASARRVRELLDTDLRIADGPVRSFPDGIPAVEFRGVSFAYGDEKVLTDVTFRLEAGKTLGIVGRTGSGKTTMARLVCRLYDPLSGSVHLDGHDIRHLSLEALRSRVGVVTQDVQLYRGTVRDNLTFFDSSVTDQRIVAVLDDLGLSDWLLSLPQGLQTVLAPSGGSTANGSEGHAVGMSAGQAQLLALGRLFLRTNPALIVLDEASSRLDPATERATDGVLRRIGGGRTTVIIAHRLSSVLHADEIMVIESGRIVEHGDRERLVSDPSSRFADLLRTSRGGALE